MINNKIYIGRFAPSPTGDLHFGSLIAALASFLDARKNQGQWLLRMDDIDHQRNVAGSANSILYNLDRLGLHWDDEVLYQSQRDKYYQAALEQLIVKSHVFPCSCSRKEIQQLTLKDGNTSIYPGTCRNKLIDQQQTYAWRLYTQGHKIAFHDRLYGYHLRDIEQTTGDFVIFRSDGISSYQLATVVDDAAQSITHVVRGFDLIDSTPKQILLQQVLSLNTPEYLHLPLATTQEGEKLSKRHQSKAIAQQKPTELILNALRFLNQHPEKQLADASIEDILDWAITHWDIKQLSQHKTSLVCESHNFK